MTTSGNRPPPVVYLPIGSENIKRIYPADYEDIFFRKEPYSDELVQSFRIFYMIFAAPSGASR